MHKESYIDQSIEDPKGIPPVVQDSLNYLIKYDKSGQWWMYDSELDNLFVIAKNAMADGDMSFEVWKTIYSKYWEHEDLVRDKER